MQTQRQTVSSERIPSASGPEADYRTSNLLATVAHELRTPLMSVLNSLEILKQADADPLNQARALIVIERQALQMKRLVADLLDVTPMTAGHIEVVRAEVDFGLVLLQAVDASRPACEACGQTLTLSASPEIIRVVGDAGRLTQVFTNLLGNASKYSASGGRISVSLERQGSDAVVRVVDDGIGIPSMWLKRIFERFVQVASSGKGAEGGLGIGLALARQIVELHGGTVSAHSEGPGRGSQFTVRLPASPA